MKEVSARWHVDIAEHSSDNSQLIVSGFLRSGITGALILMETWMAYKRKKMILEMNQVRKTLAVMTFTYAQYRSFMVHRIYHSIT